MNCVSLLESTQYRWVHAMLRGKLQAIVEAERRRRYIYFFPGRICLLAQLRGTRVEVIDEYRDEFAKVVIGSRNVSFNRLKVDFSLATSDGSIDHTKSHE